MYHVISIAVVFALGFVAGRVHHLSGLKAKVLKLEAEGALDLAKVKALLHIK